MIYSNLVSEAWNNIFTLLNSKSILADPLSFNSTSRRKWVYSRPPDVKASNFSGYPYVVVWPAALRKSGDAQTLDGRKKDYSWLIEVEIVSSDRGYNDSDGQGLTLLDGVADDVISVFNNDANRNILRANGLFFSDPSAESTPVVEAEADTMVYRRSIFIQFRGKKKVY